MTTGGRPLDSAPVVGNRRGRETRRRILDAATACFERQGMSLTLDDVAQAAGTTRMTVHRHTGGREALITELVLRESSQLADSLRTVLDVDEPFGPRLVEALVLTVETLRAADHLQDLFAGRTSAAAWPDVDPDDRVLGAIHQFFQPYFADAAARNLLRAEPDATLDWVLSQALLYLVLPATAPDTGAVRSHLETFVLPAVLSA